MYTRAGFHEGAASVAEFVRVARLSEIPPGTVKGVKARGKEILIANVDGQAYAIGDRCTHLRYHFSKGAKLEGTVLECHGHGAKFDVTDGGVCGWVTHPAWYKALMDATFPGFLKMNVPSYATRVEGDDVYVEV
jgi:3-phenylpropionate/trans-cinnamate dioxygenase ferredoxin subunit